MTQKKTRRINEFYTTPTKREAPMNGKKRSKVISLTEGPRFHRRNPEQAYHLVNEKGQKSSQKDSVREQDSVLVWKNPEFEPANSDDYTPVTKKVA